MGKGAHLMFFGENEMQKKTLDNDVIINLGLGQIAVPEKIAKPIGAWMVVIGMVLFSGLVAGGVHTVHGGPATFRWDYFIGTFAGLTFIAWIFSEIEASMKQTSVRRMY